MKINLKDLSTLTLIAGRLNGYSMVLEKCRNGIEIDRLVKGLKKASEGINEILKKRYDER